eukprot:gene19385-biopygen22882
MVWGDGSCLHEEGRAGAGLFYALGDPRNTAIRVPGEQTNQRGEAFALLHCLRTDPRPLVFITDSTYVHRGVSEWLTRWRARAWFRHPLRAEFREHADIWQAIDSELRSRPNQHVLTCWTRGHAREEQARIGETTPMLCMGNLGSDSLARRGAWLTSGTEQVPRFQIEGG